MYNYYGDISIDGDSSRDGVGGCFRSHSCESEKKRPTLGEKESSPLVRNFFKIELNRLLNFVITEPFNGVKKKAF